MNTFACRFFILFVLFAFQAVAQTEIKFVNKEKIKTENDLKGIKRGDTWVVKPQYTDITGYDDYVFCMKEGITDIYKKDWTFTRFIGGVNPEHLNFYKAYLSIIKNSNSYCTPYYKNGKWGFTFNGENTGAKFDSLFILCIENSTDNYGKGGCGHIMGVYMNGKRGVADAKGNLVVKPQDYTNIRFYYNDKQGVESSNRFEIICTYKNNEEAVFIWLKDNEFIEIKNKQGLKGYVYKGDIVDAKYTAIKGVYLPGIANYECTLPDGTIEYRKGTELVPEKDIAEAKFKEEKVQQQYKEQQEAAKKINPLLASLSKEDSLEAMKFFREDIVIYQRGFKFGLKRNDGSYDGTILTHAVFDKITFEKSPKPEMQSKSNKFMYHLAGDYMNIYYQIPSFFGKENPDYLVGYAESSTTCSKCKGSGEVTETIEETAKEWVPPVTTSSTTTTNDVHYNISSGKHENFTKTSTGTSTIVPGYYKTVVTKTDTKTVSCDACNKGVVEITHNAWFNTVSKLYIESVSPSKNK